MKLLLRRVSLIVLLGHLAGCATVVTGKTELGDRPPIRVVSVITKQQTKLPSFAFQSSAVSGAVDAGVKGMGAGALLGAAMCPVFPCMIGSGGLGALIGLIGGSVLGAKCGSLDIDADMENPVTHARRVFGLWHTERLTNALNDRTARFNAASEDTNFADVVLEVQEIAIKARNIRLTGEGRILCAVRLSGEAKWRAFKPNGERFDESTSQATRGASSESVGRWLRNEEAMREDMGLLLDDLATAIVESLATNQRATP